MGYYTLEYLKGPFIGFIMGMIRLGTPCEFSETRACIAECRVAFSLMQDVD